MILLTTAVICGMSIEVTKISFMNVVYEIGIAQLASIDKVISGLTELGVGVIKENISPVRYKLELLFPDDASIDDVFAAGTLVGTIQTAALV